MSYVDNRNFFKVAEKKISKCSRRAVSFDKLPRLTLRSVACTAVAGSHAAFEVLSRHNSNNKSAFISN